MCICCCVSRKTLIIYSIVITTIAIIYGIVAMALYASNTEVYKTLKDFIDLYDSLKTLGQLARRLKGFYQSLYGDPDLSALDIIDHASMRRIYDLTGKDLEDNPYFLIKILKKLEDTCGSILFAFPIGFLAAEIVYLVFICITGENQLTGTRSHCVLNFFKTFTYALSIIFIFLGFFYGGILIAVFYEYIRLIKNFDSCARRIIIGSAFGFYSFWFYITLACAFGRERRLFKQGGSIVNTAIIAQYDINGNPIPGAVIPAQVVVSPQVMVQPVSVQVQQVPVYNQQQPPNDINMHLKKKMKVPSQLEPEKEINSDRMLNTNKIN